MSGKVLFEFALALDVVAGEVLLVGLVDRDCAEHVENEAAADVKGNGVLSAVVEQTLDA